MNLPNTYTDRNETGCCAVPNIAEWDEREINFHSKAFLRMHTKSFLYMPLNMSKIMTALQRSASDPEVELPAEQAITLSRDLSPWKAEHLYAVSKPVADADNVTLDGTFLVKVFKGPYQDIKTWHQSMQEFVASRGKTIKESYFFYTTCPKCAKHYGKNYVIGLAKV